MSSTLLPIQTQTQVQKRRNKPIGTETPTNCPFCKAGPVFGTKFPNIIPIAIARKIHSARNRSRSPRLLKAEDLEALTGSFSRSASAACFSGSCDVGELEGMTSSEGRTLGMIVYLAGQ
jgi:hypothetical protein